MAPRRRNYYTPQDPLQLVDATQGDAGGAFGYRSAFRGAGGQVESAVGADGRRVQFVNGQAPEVTGAPVVAARDGVGPTSASVALASAPSTASFFAGRPRTSTAVGPSFTPAAVPIAGDPASAGRAMRDLRAMPYAQPATAAPAPVAGPAATPLTRSYAHTAAEGGNFDTNRAEADYVKGTITGAQRDAVNEAAAADLRAPAPVGTPARQPRGPMPYGKIDQVASPGGVDVTSTDTAGNRSISTAGGGSVFIPKDQPQTPPPGGGTGIYDESGRQMVKNADGTFARGVPDVDRTQQYASDQTAIGKAYPSVLQAGSDANKQFVDAYKNGHTGTNPDGSKFTFKAGDQANILPLAHSLFAPRNSEGANFVAGGGGQPGSTATDDLLRNTGAGQALGASGAAKSSADAATAAAAAQAQQPTTFAGRAGAAVKSFFGNVRDELTGDLNTAAGAVGSLVRAPRNFYAGLTGQPDNAQPSAAATAAATAATPSTPDAPLSTDPTKQPRVGFGSGKSLSSPAPVPGATTNFVATGLQPAPPTVPDTSAPGDSTFRKIGLGILNQPQVPLAPAATVAANNLDPNDPRRRKPQSMF